MTLQDISVTFEQIDQLKGWAYILNENINFSKTYINPTRFDKSPGCRFFQKGNDIILMDFSKRTGMNCAQCLMKTKHISYREAVLELWKNTKNFIPTGKYISATFETKRCEIQIESKPFTKGFLKYWEKLGVFEEDLKLPETRVYEVKSFFIKYEYKKIYYPNDLVIAYKGQDGYKIYFPERSKPRFKSSLTEQDVWVLVRNSKKWLIGKSHKDFLALVSITKETDWSIGMVQNEGSFPKRKDWEEAADLVTFFDNDEAGIQASDIFREYYINARSVFIEQECKAKDITDYIPKYGLEEARDYTLDLLTFKTEFPDYGR